jgi:hypothetical protein
VKLASVEAIVRALNEAGVRYMVAGGLAVNAYGFLRFTKDVDLVVDLAPDNVARAFAALAQLGYRPLVPVTAAQFGDAELRGGWIRDKGMKVLQFYGDAHRETPVDVFVDYPFVFDAEYQRSVVKELTGAGPVRLVSIRTLIELKEAAGRTEDRMDIENLRTLEDRGGQP